MASVYACGRLEVDLGRRELRVLGAPVALGDRAFGVLEALLGSSGELVSKDELMRRVWPGVVVEETTLEVHVSAVRKALGRDRALLKTAYGRGYRLLGAWRRREVGTPVDGATSAPVQRPATPFQGNLPLAASALIGRNAALHHVRDLMSAYRLVTLTGVGGIGKTRLAIEVARAAVPSFAGGAWLVELSPVSDPGLVPPAVAGVLGLDLDGIEISASAVARAIGGREILLLLDSSAHLVDAVAGMAAAGLRTRPPPTPLLTSRQP